MNTTDNTCTSPTEDSIILGAASVETHGSPIGNDEFLGHDAILGIASVETQGRPVGTDEFLGMNLASGISNE